MKGSGREDAPGQVRKRERLMSEQSEALELVASGAADTDAREGALHAAEDALFSACEAAVRAGVPQAEVRRQSNNRWEPVL